MLSSAAFFAVKVMAGTAARADAATARVPCAPAGDQDMPHDTGAHGNNLPPWKRVFAVLGHGTGDVTGSSSRGCRAAGRAVQAD
jgi:hypothetical protein